MSDKELNCEQRIDENVSQCEEHLKILFHALDEDYDDEVNAVEIKEEIDYNGYDRNSVFEYAAGISYQKVVKIELSGGGPSSHIEVYLNEDDQIIKVLYVYLDWYDGATRKVNEDSLIYRYASLYVEGM
jgi:hypothetical protein